MRKVTAEIASIRTGEIELAEGNQARAQLNDPEWASYMLGRTLMHRLGRPQEVANVALFLASDESTCITGVDIIVDGGRKVWLSLPHHRMTSR
jgi:NAD(P)-dependent dehydrogenase (short-subunit alcohol dehydrogenase family)